MELRVIGMSPAWQSPGGACSSYLLETDQKILVDCGNGAVSSLRNYLDPGLLDAVIISHFHADHCFDLVPLAYYLLYQPRDYQTRPTLMVSETETLAKLASVIQDPDIFEKAFEIKEYGKEFELGKTKVKTIEVPHLISTHAFDFEFNDTRLTYGADSGPYRPFNEFAKGSDLVILEATMPVPDDHDPRIHLTAQEAGEIAKETGTPKLVVTHFADAYDLDWVKTQVKKNYAGELWLASPGLKIKV